MFVDGAREDACNRGKAVRRWMHAIGLVDKAPNLVTARDAFFYRVVNIGQRPAFVLRDSQRFVEIQTGAVAKALARGLGREVIIVRGFEKAPPATRAP